MSLFLLSPKHDKLCNNEKMFLHMTFTPSSLSQSIQVTDKIKRQNNSFSSIFLQRSRASIFILFLYYFLWYDISKKNWTYWFAKEKQSKERIKSLKKLFHDMIQDIEY